MPEVTAVIDHNLIPRGKATFPFTALRRELLEVMEVRGTWLVKL